MRSVAPQVRFRVRTYAAGSFEAVAHFGSIWSFVMGLGRLHGSNRVAATFFHGHRDMGDPMRRAIDFLVDHVDSVGRVIVSCSVMRSRLRQWGVPDAKLVQIPIGVDLQLFVPPTDEQRRRSRAAPGVPPNHACIGSFQKDGNGWGEGLEPKLIKGPDVFLAAVRRIAAMRRYLCCSVVPRSGYVKKGLEAAGIPYRHEYVQSLTDLIPLYNCLDLYLVTSREEGGPKAITESMAIGVPLVSTRVGMAIDVVKHEINGLLADVEDVDAIVDGAVRILEEQSLSRQLIENGLATAGGLGWASVGDQYCATFISRC